MRPDSTCDGVGVGDDPFALIRATYGDEIVARLQVHPCRRVASPPRGYHMVWRYIEGESRTSSSIPVAGPVGCCHMAARRVLRGWRAFRGGTCVLGCWLVLSLSTQGVGTSGKEGWRLGWVRSTSQVIADVSRRGFHMGWYWLPGRRVACAAGL